MRSNSTQCAAEPQPLSRTKSDACGRSVADSVPYTTPSSRCPLQMLVMLQDAVGDSPISVSSTLTLALTCDYLRMDSRDDLKNSQQGSFCTSAMFVSRTFFQPDSLEGEQQGFTSGIHSRNHYVPRCSESSDVQTTAVAFQKRLLLHSTCRGRSPSIPTRSTSSFVSTLSVKASISESAPAGHHELLMMIVFKDKPQGFA